MAFAAGAAEEVPALATLGIALLALTAYVVLRGTRAVWNYTIGLILVELGNALRFSILHITIDLGGPFRSLNNTVLNNLNAAAGAADAAVGYYFHLTAVLFEWGIRETEHFAGEIGAWASWMQHVHLPRYLKWAIYAAVPPLIAVRIADYARSHVIPRVTRITRVIVHQSTAVVHGNLKPIETDLARLKLRVNGLTAAVGVIAGGLVWPHSLPGISLPKVWRGLTKRLARAERRLGRLEALLAAGGLAVAMANVLGIRNPNCLRGGPLGKLSRALCGLGANALEDLLSVLVDVFVLTDICAIVNLLVDAIPIVSGPVDTLIGGLDEALCHGDYTAPSVLTVPTVYTPTTVAVNLAGV